MGGRLAVWAIGLAVLSTGSAQAQQPAPDRNAVYAAALADPHRPAKDTARDALRKPADMLAFIGIKSGDRVVDVFAGPGYFTRLFSVAVGPTGRVYAVQPAEMNKVEPEGLTALTALAADPAYANVAVLTPAAADMADGASPPPPGPIDAIWISQNYHDLHDRFMGPVDVAAWNRAAFKALRPGGVYVVLDHAAQAGSGLRDTDTLHRIDPAAAKAEVTAAGFLFEGESPVLRNPADPLTANVFDKSIRGHTDQFVYKFRKPAR